VVYLLFDGTSIYVYTSGFVRKWIATDLGLCCYGVLCRGRGGGGKDVVDVIGWG
jgi:hypothetical protein